MLLSLHQINIELIGHWSKVIQMAGAEPTQLSFFLPKGNNGGESVIIRLMIFKQCFIVRMNGKPFIYNGFEHCSSRASDT